MLQESGCVVLLKYILSLFVSRCDIIRLLFRVRADIAEKKTTLPRGQKCPCAALLRSDRPTLARLATRKRHPAAATDARTSHATPCQSAHLARGAKPKTSSTNDGASTSAKASHTTSLAMHERCVWVRTVWRTPSPSTRSCATTRTSTLVLTAAPLCKPDSSFCSCAWHAPSRAGYSGVPAARRLVPVYASGLIATISVSSCVCSFFMFGVLVVVPWESRVARQPCSKARVCWI